MEVPNEHNTKRFQSCSGAAGPIVDPSAPIPIPVDPSTHRGRQIGVSQLFVYPDEPSPDGMASGSELEGSS